jgi:hypothetical protein
VNPREWLQTPCDIGYHNTLTMDGVVDEFYQEEELPASFVVEPGLGLDDLVGDADDIQTLEKRKWKPMKKKSTMVWFKE